MTLLPELHDLHKAIKRGDLLAVQRYVARGGAVRFSDPGVWGPLSLAAARGNTPMVRLLLDAGADVDEGWPYRCPLELAAMANSASAVELLLARGARTDLYDRPLPDVLRHYGYGKLTKILDIIQAASD